MPNSGMSSNVTSKRNLSRPAANGDPQEATPMAETKRQIPMPPDNKLVDAWEVPIATSTERWSEFELEDGSVIRAKVNAVGFIRIENQYDPDGNPIYAMLAQNVHVIGSVPDKLKRKVN
jgi:hypothetical protein